MKKPLIFGFILLFLLTYSHLLCQNFLGIAGGTNVTLPYGNTLYSPDFEHEFGINFSIIYRNNNDHKFHFSTELQFIKKEYKDHSVYSGHSSSRLNTQNRLSFIVFTPYIEISENKITHINLAVGPSIGILTCADVAGSQTTRFPDNQILITNIQTGCVKKFPALDLRGSVKFGIETSLSETINITLDNIYSIGFTHKQVSDVANLDLKTVDVIFQLGLMFKMN